MAHRQNAAEDRNDARERRRRLRALDFALGEEIEDAGALTFDEFRKHVSECRLLGDDVQDATLWEWWHFAQRRQLIERRSLDTDGYAYGLTAEGQTRLAGRRVAETTLIMPTVARVARSAAKEPPLTLAIALIALVASSPSGAAWVIFLTLVATGVLVVGPVVDRFVARRLDAFADQSVLALHIAWLEGREVRRPLLLSNDPAVSTADIVRLPAPPLPASTPQTHETS